MNMKTTGTRGASSAKILQDQEISKRNKIYQDCEKDMKKDIKAFARKCASLDIEGVEAQRDILKRDAAYRITGMLERLGWPKGIACGYDAKKKQFYLQLPDNGKIEATQSNMVLADIVSASQTLATDIISNSENLSTEGLGDTAKQLSNLMGSILSNMNDSIDSLAQGTDNKTRELSALKDEKRAASTEKNLGITLFTFSLLVSIAMAVCLGIALATTPVAPVMFAVGIMGTLMGSVAATAGVAKASYADNDIDNINSKISNMVAGVDIEAIPITKNLLDPLTQSLMDNLKLDVELSTKQQQAPEMAR